MFELSRREEAEEITFSPPLLLSCLNFPPSAAYWSRESQVAYILQPRVVNRLHYLLIIAYEECTRFSQSDSKSEVITLLDRMKYSQYKFPCRTKRYFSSNCSKVSMITGNETDICPFDTGIAQRNRCLLTDISQKMHFITLFQ